jgi:hypothetical protein
MTLSSKRVVALVFAAVGLIVGAWAAAAPRSFYDTFPLPGHPWVEALPAYNEHLTRDVGELYLAVAVVSLWAGLRRSDELLRCIGAAWLVFGLPHLAFHAAHLGVYSRFDAVANAVVLGAMVLLAAALLVPVRRSRPSEPSTPAPGLRPAAPPRRSSALRR